MKRYKISKSKSKKTFRNGAIHTNKKNNSAIPMRGGYRL